MTHNDLVNLCLSYHTPVMVAVLAAYYKYGDRTEIFRKSLQGTDATLTRLRQKIAVELEKKLQPIFENSGTMSVLLIPESYTERPANPVGSEVYRESIRDFLDTSSEAVGDYRTLYIARRRWCFWAKFLSWSLLVLLGWQFVVVGSIMFVDKVGGIPISDWLLKWSALPSGLVMVCCLTSLPCMLRCHDVIIDYRMRYD